MRFPRIHIATSVVNRILEMGDQEMLRARATEAPAGLQKTTQAQSEQLDAALQSPLPTVPAPVGSEEAVLMETAQGGSAADAIGSMAALDAI